MGLMPQERRTKTKKARKKGEKKECVKKDGQSGRDCTPLTPQGGQVAPEKGHWISKKKGKKGVNKGGLMERSTTIREMTYNPKKPGPLGRKKEGESYKGKKGPGAEEKSTVSKHQEAKANCPKRGKNRKKYKC